MTQRKFTGREAFTILGERTGVVIPVFFPDALDFSIGESLLEDTVSLFCTQVKDPGMICLSFDGDHTGLDSLKRMAGRFGVSTVTTPVNRGKFSAVANGMRFLMEHKNPEFLAAIDQDGDHFANELMNFVRAALHITACTRIERVLVLGRRISRHRPMGFLRGELEELADRILLDALQYHAAVARTPLRLEYANMFDEYPDFHSGYKLFNAPLAQSVFFGEPLLCGVSGDCYYRHAVEAVMVVESLEAGAYLGVVNRSTINEQPISTFGLVNRIRLTSDKIIWPCKRLDIPPAFVEQWLANHIPRLLLQTLSPEGKKELMAIRKTVLESLGNGWDDDSGSLFQPMFL